MDNLNILHNLKEKKFYVFIDNMEAYLKYSYYDNDTLDFYHTYVPPVHRGKNIAYNILKKAAEYAKKSNKKIIPSCSYAYYFFQKNKKYRDLIS